MDAEWAARRDLWMPFLDYSHNLNTFKIRIVENKCSQTWQQIEVFVWIFLLDCQERYTYPRHFSGFLTEILRQMTGRDLSLVIYILIITSRWAWNPFLDSFQGGLFLQVPSKIALHFIKKIVLVSPLNDQTSEELWRFDWTNPGMFVSWRISRK